MIILCDVEGFEYELINKSTLLHFSNAIWIIELHEFNDQMLDRQLQIIQMLKQMNYNIKTLRTGSRDFSDITETLMMDDVDRWLICAEGRGQRSGKWVVIQKS